MSPNQASKEVGENISILQSTGRQKKRKHQIRLGYS